MRRILVAAAFAFASQSSPAQTCTGLCLQQTSCPGGGSTTISGTVYMPNGVLPLANALVYVPNAPVAPFTAGVACDSCSPSGSPLVSGISGATGTFTVSNMPVGGNIPLVIQVGRWRRQVVLPSVVACTNTVVSATLSRMPRNKNEGDVPLTAVVTGAADQEECLLRQIGVDDSEFTNPSGAGRIRFYTGSVPGGGGAIINTNTPSETALVASQASLNQYDAVMMNCQGNTATPTMAAKGVFTNFLNSGGRALLFHYADGYLQGNPPLSSLTNWNPDQSGITDPQTGYIDTSATGGAMFAQWLQSVAGGTYGQLQLSQLRHDYDGVFAPAVNLISLNQSGQIIPQQFSANAPVGSSPSSQCGRFTFVNNHPSFQGVSASGVVFPSECSASAMTPQQMAAAYTLFDTENCLGGAYDRIFASGFESGG